MSLLTVYATAQPQLWQQSEPSANLATISNGIANWFNSAVTASTGAAPVPAASPARPSRVRPACVCALPGVPSFLTPPAQSLQAFFELAEEEHILESFTCSLLQTVDCTHNEYTRGLQLTLPGILCVTDVHVCFVGDDATSVPPFKLAHKRVAKVSSPRPTTRGGASDA